MGVRLLATEGLALSLHQPLEDHAVLAVWVLADLHHPGKFPTCAAEAVQPPRKGVHAVRCCCPFFNLVLPALSHVSKRRSGGPVGIYLPARTPRQLWPGAAEDPMSPLVRRADVVDHADEVRLALLPGDVADRLRGKYARAGEILDGPES